MSLGQRQIEGHFYFTTWVVLSAILLPKNHRLTGPDTDSYNQLKKNWGGGRCRVTNKSRLAYKRAQSTSID